MQSGSRYICRLPSARMRGGGREHNFLNICRLPHASTDKQTRPLCSFGRRSLTTPKDHYPIWASADFPPSIHQIHSCSMFPILQSRTPFQIVVTVRMQIVRIIFDWKSIVPSFSRAGSLPSITVSCIFALSCQVCSSTPPPSSLSCSLYLCWAGKGQGQRISTIYSSKQKRRLLPFNSLAVSFAGVRSFVSGNVLPANSS